MIRSYFIVGGVGLALLTSLGCTSKGDDGPELSKANEPPAIPKVGPIPKSNPELGAIADVTPVLEGPFKSAKRLGYLHAGAKVNRSKEPLGNQDCDKGWYAVRPRGFVCAEGNATIELGHPTLIAMSILPTLAEPMPFTYARTTKDTPLYEQDSTKKQGVRQIGKLRARAGMSVVGSWEAQDEEGQNHRLALMTNGQFLRAVDLKAATPSDFSGTTLDAQNDLPIAYIVRRGIKSWKIGKGSPSSNKELDYHSRIPLSGRFRTIDKLRYWAVADGTSAPDEDLAAEKLDWVRHKDATVIRRRNNFPDFASGEQKWLDVSVITGTLVAYEGKRPVYATLVSVGRDRLGDPETTRSTKQGTFDVLEKHITLRGFDPRASQEGYELYDLPWALKLSSGQWLHAAYWHDRFGIEHSEGGIHLSPADAAWLFQWAGPSLPEGWHSVVAEGDGKTIVNIRK